MSHTYADARNTAIITGLQNGILLEDTNELLPWWSHWTTLRSIGAPNVFEEHGTHLVLRWEDRACFGSLNCSLSWQCGTTARTCYLARIRVYLPVRAARNHNEAVDEFHDSVRLLRSIFGRPDVLDERLVAPGPEMGGLAKWGFPRFVVTHSLSTPWDGFCNATNVEARQSFVRRLVLHVKTLLRYRTFR